MGNTPKKYLYADKKEQVQRANHVMAVGGIIYYTFVLVVLWMSHLEGVRTLGYCAFLSVLTVIAMLSSVCIYRHDPQSGKVRYSVLIGLLIITFFMLYVFDNYYIGLMALSPIVGCFLFFDRRFSAIAGISCAIENILIFIIKVGVRQAYDKEYSVDYAVSVAVVFMMISVIYIVARVAARFDHDSRHGMMQEQEKLKKVMADVIAVAEQVKEGTQNAMDKVTQLNASTEVVKGAMQDISDSNQNTAENIQTQTTMTQNIQNAIEHTLESSDNMVQVAKHSGELSEQSRQIMEELKEHSVAIADTNATVAASMKQLQDRASAVRSIADTIFSISSQTNLLALNASIESARAGEAGRGFAVVADEIRKLAEETRQETDHIASLLGELSENAESAANAVKDSIEAADAQGEIISKASDSIGEITDNVDHLVNSINEIDGMLTNLSESNNQIVENIMTLSATTQEVTASSTQAAELSADNMDKAEQTRTYLDNVLKVSHELNKYV